MYVECVCTVLIILAVVVIIMCHKRYSKTSKLNIAAFFINLDRRGDRLKHCLSQLTPHFHVLDRYAAVEGRYVDTLREPRLTLFYDLAENKKWDASIRFQHTRRMTHGEIGCCLSHRNIWETAYGRNIPIVAIFEDDVVIGSMFKLRLRRALDNCPRDWDILYLGYITNNGGLGEWVPGKRLRHVKLLFGAYAYILRRKGLQKLIGALPIDRPIDNFLGKLTENGTLNGYAIVPPIADQIEYGGYGSDIVHSAHL